MATPDNAPQTTPPTTSEQTQARRRRPGQQLTCGWCKQPITVRRVGRTPKWCSDTCRHRAWEQTRAAAADRSAVQVVDRLVEIEVAVPGPVEKVKVVVSPRGPAWVPTLGELAHQLDTGQIYNRDLAAITQAIQDVHAALRRRTMTRTGRVDRA